MASGPGPAAGGLIRARFLRRYQRFLADVELDGRVVTVHVPNTGSMATVLHPGCDAWLAAAPRPGRKLPWTLVLLALPQGGFCLVDTGVPNRIVDAGIRAGLVPSLAGYGSLQREVPIGTGGSRCDILLQAPGRRCWIEIKNCTQAGAADGQCDFPDAVTERGTRHLHALSARVGAGDRAVQFYLLGRSDCDRIGIAAQVDPVYAQAVRAARAAGVEFIAHRAILSPAEIRLGDAVAFVG